MSARARPARSNALRRISMIGASAGSSIAMPQSARASAGCPLVETQRPAIGSRSRRPHYLSHMPTPTSSPALRTELDLAVIVIGAGHAGTEAAVAAARLGARVGLIPSALETIGQMSCNPAIGGVAKGTVAREVDALGGIMGRATDMAMLQFRMLNRSKGPAVWAPRAQCDRGLYRRAVRTLLEQHPSLHIIQGTVARLLLDSDGGRVIGVETLEGRRFGASAVIITTGTFLRGR